MGGEDNWIICRSMGYLTCPNLLPIGLSTRICRMVNELEHEITSVAEFLEKIQIIVESNSGLDLFFRGQTQRGTKKDKELIPWEPSPSIFREDRIAHEKEYYSHSMTECAGEFSSCHSHCEILSTMQHYGVPTRLLDITSNALVSLFFACVSEEGKVNNKETGVVLIIGADKAHVREYDSDTITILSSLSRFTKDEQNEIKETAQIALRSENPIVEFNDGRKKQVQRLLHEIKKEKPAFEPIIEPRQLLENYIFTPQKTNPRIIRQSGAFILFGLENTSLPDNSSTDYPKVINKLFISKKNQIVKTLEQCGISLATMYPELYKVAEYLKNSKLKVLNLDGK